MIPSHPHSLHTYSTDTLWQPCPRSSPLGVPASAPSDLVGVLWDCVLWLPCDRDFHAFAILFMRRHFILSCFELRGLLIAPSSCLCLCTFFKVQPYTQVFIEVQHISFPRWVLLLVWRGLGYWVFFCKVATRFCFFFLLLIIHFFLSGYYLREKLVNSSKCM